MKILLIEDDADLAQHIRADLAENGYLCEVAYDGRMAEKMLRKGGHDCVVMDVNLPYRNGYELCQQFRQYNTATPVIMLTAFDELDDKMAGFDAGADDYLTKPFYFKELHARIRVLVKRNAAGGASPQDSLLVVGDLVLDLPNKAVKRAGQPIELTAREYQILLALAQARGNLVSKQELMRTIWGSSFEGNTNTVEVFINFLRNKIDKPFPVKLIKTRIGHGYYLDVQANTGQ